MKRKVLIIINPGVVGDEHYCKGVYVDRDNYKAYFMSSIGGYWNESEIIIREKPSRGTVLLDLVSMSDCDYSIVIFCGHGYYSERTMSNMLILNDENQVLDSDKIKQGCTKRLIILDCCRDILPEYAIESEELRKAIRLFDSVSGKRLRPERCKRIYNEWIHNNCPNQIIVGLGCAIDESCGDSSRGGYYSLSLLKAARQIGDDMFENADLMGGGYEVSSFVRCHNGSKELVAKISGNKQNPDIEKPRSGNYLPFVVVA